ncbi:MAG: hypothetical protein Q7U97_03780 [Rhodocyclaceae bacterium]|nr:hypothetical protein [Rhodocyclaceae bacterium]
MYFTPACGQPDKIILKEAFMYLGRASPVAPGDKPASVVRHGFAGLLAVLAVSQAFAADANTAKCLYVSSYHPGYEWSDGIERGLADGLRGKCELSRFYMDTNRNTEPRFAMRKALEAKQLIEQSRPDVVIACDDAASQYLIQPYFKNAAVPIVFCGVNWTVKAYGYPYSNVTGMIEIAPIKPLIKEVRGLLPSASSGIYLAADVITQHKEFEENRAAYAKGNIGLSPIFVKTMGAWQAAFAKAQKADFVVLGTNAGINDWDAASAYQSVMSSVTKLVVTNYDWMAPYAVLAMTKVAEEQGEWSAHLA